MNQATEPLPRVVSCSVARLVSPSSPTKSPPPPLPSLTLELKSRKGGKRREKAGKGGKGGFGYAISLLANMPKCHKMP